MPTVRSKKRNASTEAVADAPGALPIGTRVTMTGAVVSASDGEAPWLLVRLDGEREKIVACWLSDVKVTP